MCVILHDKEKCFKYEYCELHVIYTYHIKLMSM